MLSRFCIVSWKREALDVAASDDPPDEALSCRRRAWDVPYLRTSMHLPDSHRVYLCPVEVTSSFLYRAGGQSLSAPKSRDSLRLRRRFLTPPLQNRAIFKAPSSLAISFAKKIASERRFSLRLKGTNLIPTAEFPAIPESAAKIASERRFSLRFKGTNLIPTAEFPAIPESAAI